MSNIPWSGSFIRIAAQPVHHVCPPRHAARSPGVAAEVGKGVTTPVEGRRKLRNCHRSRVPAYRCEAEGCRRTIVEPLPQCHYAMPARRQAIVKRDVELSIGLERDRGELQCPPHLARVVEDTPGIDYIKCSERAEIRLIDGASLFYDPGGIVGMEAAPQLRSTADGPGVIVERPHRGSEIPCGKREQPRPGPNVQKRAPLKRPKPFSEALLRKADALGCESLEIARPVCAERKARVGHEPGRCHSGAHGANPRHSSWTPSRRTECHAHAAAANHCPDSWREPVSTRSLLDLIEVVCDSPAASRCFEAFSGQCKLIACDGAGRVPATATGVRDMPDFYSAVDLYTSSSALGERVPTGARTLRLQKWLSPMNARAGGS